LLERWYELDGDKRFVLPESAIKDEKAEKEKERKKEEDKKNGITEEPIVAEPPIPLSGSISVGGHNLDTVGLKWWRSQIGLVQQEPFIFNDTIYKNVEFGLLGSQWEHANEATKKNLVEEACKEAFADEYITRLPQGYDTPVGDAGIKLSGGQRRTYLQSTSFMQLLAPSLSYYLAISRLVLVWKALMSFI
tara:strand:+ start:1320 stop:1892 length:573 start_codon:yes stop_codon:yes gene_type:complete